MQTLVKKLPKSEVEIAVTITTDELRPFLEAAAQELATTSKIEGFRPGKAPYDLVARRFGEMKIYEAALEAAVRSTYVKALAAEKIQAVGQPKIDVKTLAPGNPLTYTATVPVLPAIIKLADYRSIKVTRHPIEIKPKDVDAALVMLQKMQRREASVDRAAGTADKIVVDMDLMQGGVAIEGGQARGHAVELAEPYYVPGFTEAVVGIKKGETRNFTLNFPPEHYQKNIADKPVDFKVTATDVVELSPPTLDDAFASSLGQPSLAALKDLLEKNLHEEAEGKESARLESEIIKQIVAGSQFEDFPAVLVNAECERMLLELERSVAAQGVSFDDYLKNLKKTRAEIKLSFAQRAVERLKAALAVRAVAEKEGVTATDEEVMAEVTRQINLYKDDPETQKNIREPEYAEAVRGALRNQKVMKFLKELVVI